MNEYESDQQVTKDELVSLEIDHIKVNQPDLEYCFSLIMSELAQIYAINHRDHSMCRRLILQQMEESIKVEAVYRADQRLEE